MATAKPSSVEAIQPIGFLFIVSSDWQVRRVSANIDRFFATTPEQLLGQPMASLFTEDAIHGMRNRLALMRGPDEVERLFACPLAGGDEHFDVSLHISGGSVVIEGEPANTRDQGDVTGIVRGMIGQLDKAVGLTALVNEGARQVRTLTGFDRVTVHRVAADGAGEIVAESVKSGIGTLLGRHYPASDFAAGLRERLTHPLLSFVADRNAAPVPIVAPIGERGQPIDLSLSVLHAGSPNHLAHLRDMAMRAEVSISIIVGGALWGLIVCHHGSPRCPSFERRSIAELFALMFAMRIEICELKAVIEKTRPA